MTTSARVNPHKPDALTVETVKAGDRILSWRPNTSGSTKRLVVLNHPYADDDGDMVVEVRYPDGSEKTLLTSVVGLSGERHTGQWEAIAIIDDSTDD